jgi:hypothetical protein
VGLTEPASKLEALPDVVERVTAPRLFAPSTFASLMRCPLKEIHDLPDESMLPPSPLVILGDVIHEVMSEARSDRMLHRRSTTAYVDELFERKVRCEEARLSEDPRTKRLVPIRRAVGKSEYQNRRARLRDWASGLSGDDRDPASESPMEVPRARVGHEAKPAETTSIPLGAERTIRVSSLRLSGRPDLIERDGDGTYHVTDFKTGDVLDRAGEPRADYALQVRLYALMLRQIDENASSRLWLEGSEKVEVQWDENLAAETMEQLLSVTEHLPAGQVLYAADIVQPGAHCGSCRIRHRCQRYRSVAPGWWTEKSSRGSVAPFDIWSEVKEILASGEETAEVVLQDAAGRRVRVTGIRAEGARRGDRMWFFDLQPTQRLPHHGLFVHPQNFHAKRPDRVWRDAVRCSEFIESRTAEWE